MLKKSSVLLYQLIKNQFINVISYEKYLTPLYSYAYAHEKFAYSKDLY